jgi:hypothetical protein
VTFQCRGLQSIAFYHGMFPWLGIHLLECDGDYCVEMLKQQITGTDRCPRSSFYSFYHPQHRDASCVPWPCGPPCRIQRLMALLGSHNLPSEARVLRDGCSPLKKCPLLSASWGKPNTRVTSRKVSAGARRVGQVSISQIAARRFSARGRGMQIYVP